MALTDEERAERERAKTHKALCRQAIKALQPLVNVGKDRRRQYEREWLGLLGACNGERSCDNCGYAPLTVDNNVGARTLAERFTVRNGKRRVKNCPGCKEPIDVARLRYYVEPTEEYQEAA